MGSLETAVPRELNKIYSIRWELRKTRVHTKGMQRNRKPETNNVSLSRELRYSWRDRTYCRGNSVHSRSLPPLVNHCNIRAGGIRCWKARSPPPTTTSTWTFNLHAKLFAYLPTDRTLELRNSIETVAARSNCSRIGCYRLKLRKRRRENMNEESNENSNEKFATLKTPLT